MSGDPPLLPSLTLPAAPELPQAVLEVPRAQLPNYKPLVVPPNTLRPPPGIEGVETEDNPPKKTALGERRLHWERSVTE